MGLRSVLEVAMTDYEPTAICRDCMHNEHEPALNKCRRELAESKDQRARLAARVKELEKALDVRERELARVKAEAKTHAANFAAIIETQERELTRLLAALDSASGYVDCLRDTLWMARQTATTILGVVKTIDEIFATDLADDSAKPLDALGLGD